VALYFEEETLDATTRGTYDLTVALRDRLSDAEPSTYVSMEAQLRKAVFERLNVQAESERETPRRTRSWRRGR